MEDAKRSQSGAVALYHIKSKKYMRTRPCTISVDLHEDEHQQTPFVMITHGDSKVSFRVLAPASAVVPLGEKSERYLGTKADALVCSAQTLEHAEKFFVLNCNASGSQGANLITSCQRFVRAEGKGNVYLSRGPRALEELWEVRPVVPYGGPARILHIPWKPETWMADLFFGVLSKLPLSQIFMVGAHDAASFAITTRSEYSPDAPGLLAPSSSLVSRTARAAAKKIAVALSVAQKLSVFEQLRFGVRYLDIRLCAKVSKEGTTSLYATHGLYSVSLQQVLEDVLVFLHDSPDEFILFDVQSLWGGRQHLDLLMTELAPLLKKCIPNTVDVAKLTLEELRKRSSEQRVLLTLHLGGKFGPPTKNVQQQQPPQPLSSSVHIRNDVLVSNWHNCDTPRDLVLALQLEHHNHNGHHHHNHRPHHHHEHHHRDHHEHTDPQDDTLHHNKAVEEVTPPSVPLAKFHIVQGVLTPRLSTIFRKPSLCLVSLAQRINPIILQMFRDDHTKECSFRNNNNAETKRQEIDITPEDKGTSRGSAVETSATNLFKNIVMIDYVQLGVCDWHVVDDDADGVKEILQIDAVKLCCYLNILRAIRK